MSNNYSVKRFRHAISLDERRVKFRPILWNEETSESERSLDVDFPDVRIKFEDSNVDVKEVWFAGDLTSHITCPVLLTTAFVNIISRCPCRCWGRWPLFRARYGSVVHITTLDDKGMHLEDGNRV